MDNSWQERKRRLLEDGDRQATVQSTPGPETPEDPADREEDEWGEEGEEEGGGEEESDFEDDVCEGQDGRRQWVQPYHSAETHLFLAILVSCVVGCLRPRRDAQGWNILRPGAL